MSTLIQVLQRFFGLLKLPHLIHNRLALLLLHKLNHLLKSVLWSIHYAFKRNISIESQDISVQSLPWNIFSSRQVTDAVDEPTESDAIE